MKHMKRKHALALIDWLVKHVGWLVKHVGWLVKHVG